jgi:hypothetical protein
MVAWSGDGTLAGYDALTKRLKKGLYHFASPGSVDVEAITRLAVPMGPGLNLTTYPNNLMAQAPLTFSTGDFAANPGKKLGVGMIICRASAFPEGYIPTPAEIFALPMDKIDLGRRSTEYATSGPITHTYELPTSPSSGFFWNTKWWVLLYPSAIINDSALWSKTNDAPIAGANINVVGRALSFWSSRTPAKPTIVSPVNGSLGLPGTEVQLLINPADPDEVAPEDAAKYNNDVNGLHVQYRPAPTVDSPDPDWRDMPFDWQFYHSGAGEWVTVRREAWHIRGSRYWAGLPGTPYHEAMIANLGFPIVCAGPDGPLDHQPGKGALPSGEWQIRARTFDYGHPYPNKGTVVTEPGPLGINPATNWLLEPAKDTYPEQDRSPWSDPVRFTIPAQVPPALPVYPKDDIAVSGNLDSVQLRWNYRNTYQPPRDQYLRTVQIRKVGDPEWATVFDGASSEEYVDLPFTLLQDDIPEADLMTDGNFEGGTTGNWFVNYNGEDPTSVITNVLNGANAHSGSRYMKLSNTAGATNDGSTSVTMQTITVPEEYNAFALDGWVWIPPGVDGFLLIQMVWYNDDLTVGYSFPTLPDGSGLDMNYPYAAFLFSAAPTEIGVPDTGGWFRLSEMTPINSDMDRLSFKRHPEGERLLVYVSANTNITDGYAGDWRLDDLTLTASGTGLDSFHIEATNHYEWRVQTTDTDFEESGFSEPARFWVVPAGATGEVRPIPTGTLDGATLGCGKHTVEVYRRGGVERVGVLGSISHLDWERKRDDISTAEVVISGWDVDCGNLLARLQTWAYELVIWRDNGFSKDRVWEGPITLLTYQRDKVTIDAKDVMGYAYRRIIKQQMNDTGSGHGTTVVDRARRVLQNVFAPDDPNILSYLQVLSRSDDAMQYRSTPAYSRTAFEEIDDMAANAGLDYAAVGRSILLWGTKHRIGTLPEFRDADLGDSPIVSEYGMSMANVYSVSDGNGIHGEANRLVSGNDETYGLVEMLSSTWASDSEEETGTYTQEGLATVIESFEDFADRSISNRYPPPVIVRVPDNTTLNPDTVISIQHLVPGVVVPLRSNGTLRSVVASQKLDAVKVVEEAGKETVSITLSPFSRDDAAVVEEEGE